MVDTCSHLFVRPPKKKVATVKIDYLSNLKPGKAEIHWKQGKQQRFMKIENTVVGEKQM
jgi:hypothetical protein